MLFRCVLSALVALALATPAAAQDEAALIQKRQQVPKFFKDPDLH